MFERERLYTRSEVAELIGYPVEKRDGGAWMTGGTEFGGAFYIFANIGKAGRTGHNYPNRWNGKELILPARTNSHVDQPQIQRMISGKYPVHIFWRGEDRSAFSYAGEAKAVHIADTVPVEITWAFDSDRAGSIGKTAPHSKIKGSRRGPPPSRGRRSFEIEDKSTTLYLMVLTGPGLQHSPVRTDGREFVKVGISTLVQRRIRELNFGFPPGLDLFWEPFATVEFPTGREAFEAEGRMLEYLRRNGAYVGGEFAIIELGPVLKIFGALKTGDYEGATELAKPEAPCD